MAQHGDHANGLPLKGVVLCSTSVMQDVRNKLAEYAIEMGAVHMLDLTGDVTHLIVGDVRTPKYRYVAKARPEMKVLQPEWVEAVRSQWLIGDDVDVAALERDFKCPTLAGLHICVTGFQSFEERVHLEQTVQQLGATYSGDLTKQVTQLIVAVPQGAKYTHAKQWGIPCVSSKWLEDSMQRGMALDESLYDPLLPEEEQGKGAYRFDVPKATTGKRQRDESQLPDDIGKRKLRRTASTRLEGHSQDLWQDISEMGNAKASVAIDQWQDRTEQTRKQTSIAPAKEESAVQPAPVPARLFTGWRMCLQGFPLVQKEKLQHVLHEKCGAEVVENASLLRLGEAASHCILVPHLPPTSLYYLSRTTSETVLATEWWVERCLMARKVLEPAEDILSTPFWSADLPSMSDISVSSTGFNSVDLRQVAEVVRASGGNYQQQLEQTTTVLISNSANVKKEKAFYAKKHNIPVVTPEWLWTSIKTKRRQHFEPFRIATNILDAARSARDRPSGHSRASSGSGHVAGPQAVRPPKIHAAKKGPFVHEDDGQNDSIPSINESTIQPLQERSPNTSQSKRSPYKGKQQSPAKDEAQHQQENLRSPEELNADIASLSHKLLESRPAAAEGDRRKKRTLGRAASAISNRSVTISAEPSLEDRLDLWDDPNAHIEEMKAAAPSTQLGYEVPEAEAHRLQMAKRMGTSFADEHGGTKLASIGTVRDAHGRTRSRRHKAIS